MAIDVTKLLGVTGEIKDFLGWVFWFSVPADHAEAEMVVKACNAVGMAPPNPINPVDAFRRVTKSVECKRQEIPGQKDAVLNLLVRDVRTTQGRVYRQMVEEIVDSENIRLSYRPVAQWIFHRSNAKIETELLDNDLSEAAIAAIEAVEANYDRDRTHYTGNHIRDLLRKEILHASGVALRESGGIYFLPRSQRRQVEMLKAWSSHLRAADYRLLIADLPVIDSPDHREMVLEVAEQRMKDACLALGEKVRKHLQKDETPPPSVVARYVQELRDVRKVTKNYEQLLETSVESVREYAEMTEILLETLLDRA